MFVRRCTSKYSNEAITFPKLKVVLAGHLFGSTSRRMLVNAVELRRNYLPTAVHHNALYRTMQSVNRHVIECPSKAAPNFNACAQNLYTCGSSAIPAR